MKFKSHESKFTRSSSKETSYAVCPQI